MSASAIPAAQFLADAARAVPPPEFSQEQAERAARYAKSKVTQDDYRAITVIAAGVTLEILSRGGSPQAAGDALTNALADMFVAGMASGIEDTVTGAVTPADLAVIKGEGRAKTATPVKQVEAGPGHTMTQYRLSTPPPGHTGLDLIVSHLADAGGSSTIMVAATLEAKGPMRRDQQVGRATVPSISDGEALASIGFTIPA